MAHRFEAVMRSIGALVRSRMWGSATRTGARYPETRLSDLDDRLLDDLGLTRSGEPLPREPSRNRAPQRRGVGRQSGGAISKPAKSKPGETVQLTSVQAPRLVAVCQ
jgi:hypothetical protein